MDKKDKGQGSRRCVQITVKGERCKAWAMVSSVRPLCSSHSGANVGAGAPVGNQNALKHGFYGRHYREIEVVDLLNLGTDMTLVDEIALARVQLRRVWDELNNIEPSDLDRFIDLSGKAFEGLGRVGRLVVDQHRMGGGATLEDLLGAVLDGIGKDWEGGL